MARRPHESMSEQLAAGQLLIDNTLANEDILDLVTAFGYTSAKMSEGRALYETAEAAVKLQTGKMGRQQEATEAMVQAEAMARDAYQALAKVARAVFSQQPSQLGMLGLTGPTPKNIAGFLTSAYTLFDNAVDLSVLADYGYTAEKLQTEREKIEDLKNANEQQERAKGVAQEATAAQEIAMKNFNDWVAQYRKVAKVALRGNKQMLEELGIAARTSPTAAQRAGVAKAAATRAANKNQ